MRRKRKPISGSRGRDFRGGDLAEGLGLELLRPFAFIAPVPRTEDIGIDAVATLFRRETHRLIAEGSFLVQAKAASVRKIEYKGEALDWLRTLSLPMFWMSVKLATTTVELWSMAMATTHPNFRNRKSVTMYLDDHKFDLDCDEMHVWLGHPILRWTPTDAADPAFQQTAYDLLNAWIAFEMQCLAVRPLGMTYPIRWETNKMPEPHGSYAIMESPGELKGVLEKIQPLFHRLMMNVALTGKTNDDLLMGLLLISEFMRREGVNPDPSGLLPMFAKVRASQGDSNITITWNKAVVPEDNGEQKTP
jgi:hypothetical protein